MHALLFKRTLFKNVDVGSTTYSETISHPERYRPDETLRFQGRIKFTKTT